MSGLPRRPVSAVTSGPGFDDRSSEVPVEEVVDERALRERVWDEPEDSGEARFPIGRWDVLVPGRAREGMEKQGLRERIWDELEESGEARFPFPPHGRIPNFAGAVDAAERLARSDAWQAADVIKSNPDSPQLPVRRAALRQGKTLYMAVPRLRDENCFLRLDPGEIEDVDRATTVGGSSDVGEQVGPGDMDPIDLIVSGSVAVNGEGARVGKGEGYSDLEFAILREFGLVDDETTTVTTVHEIQVVEEDISTTPHDVPIELIITPERTIRTGHETQKPTGIEWDELDDDRIEEIPILFHIRSK